VAEGIAVIAGDLGFSGYFGGIAAGLVTLGLAALAAGAAGYVALRGIGRLYKARGISDQSIQIDAVWLIFAITHAPMQLPLAGLAAFALCALVTRSGLHLFLSGHATDSRPPRLLLLRVFGLGKRSEHLCRARAHDRRPRPRQYNGRAARTPRLHGRASAAPVHQEFRDARAAPHGD
jgi:hypothetical protein